MSIINAIQGLGGSFFGNSRATNQISQADSKATASMAELAKSMQSGSTGGVDASKLLESFSLNNVDKAAKTEMGRLGSSTQDLSEVNTNVFANLSRTSESGASSFASMLTGFVDSVDAKSKASEQATSDLMLGKSDNIHQAMIAMQEASISFDLLVQVRNKLVDSYKELSRIQA
ncbi:MAG: flagellar hook-basal body complex protein FliE [Opitutales bacterium]|nr:flagellar hook-basal body complex protein FliE [Opitutales bacterium]